MSRLGRVLCEVDDPPVKALVVYNSNPAAIAPNQALIRKGLAREDLFTVVLEQFLTDTADWADIVLPSTTFLEHPDLYFSYGHYFIQLSKAAVEPQGEARDEHGGVPAAGRTDGFSGLLLRRFRRADD